MTARARTERLAVWQPLIRQLTGQGRALAVGGGLALVGGLLGLVQPMAAKAVVDALSDGHGMLRPALALGGLVLAAAVVTGLGEYRLQAMAEDVVRRSRQRLAEQVLRLPVTVFDRLGPGDVLSRVTSDTMLLRATAGQALVGSGTSLLLALGAVAAMAWLDPLLCGAVLAVLAVSAVGTVLALPRVTERVRQAQAAVGDLGDSLDRALGAFRTVKANGMEDALSEEARAAADRAARAGVRAAGWEVLASGMSTLAVHLAFFAALGLGGARVVTGRLDVADLIAFLFYLVFAGPLIGEFATAVGTLRRGLAAAQRIAEIEDLPVEDPGPAASPGPAPATPAALSFTDVHFRYPGRHRPAVHGLTLDVPADGLTAVVGPSGAGKSTLFALVERFYTPERGSVRVDGRDLADWPLAELRSTVGYVEQETPVLAGTLRGNLLLAAPRATKADLHRVLALTQLDRLADELPDGLDTEVGHRGAALSGGQRQRLALARALLRRPRLLLLDEVTSQLDTASERAVRDTLAGLSGTTAVMVSAHRLATVRDAARIVVLDGGRVRAVGTHEELVATDALYADLVRDSRDGTLGPVPYAGETPDTPGQEVPAVGFQPVSAHVYRT